MDIVHGRFSFLIANSSWGLNPPQPSRGRLMQRLPFRPAPPKKLPVAMSVSSAACRFLLCLCLALVSGFAAASPRNLRFSAEDFAAVEATLPQRHRRSSGTTFFEVDRPLNPPKGSSGPCSTLLLSHSFALTLTKPPVTAAYSPPSCLLGAGEVSLAVLEWRATCHGVQYDRIFGVWLGGAELLRGSTAEPRPGGVSWSVSKDVTRYAPLLAAGNATLAVYLGNLIDDTYNGVYHANLTLHLYFRRRAGRRSSSPSPAADAVVPVSRSLPVNDGLWFVVTNSTDVQSARVAVPPNAYRAVLEVYVSSHYADEFWYMNTPEQKGPFREVTVLLDGEVVGAVWPFPVIYTGGINPLIWRPITSIGSFNFPTYDIELTPFLGKLLDSEQHELGFVVTNAQNSWFVDANLHLWLDHKSSKTTAGLIAYDAPKLAGSIVSRSDDGIDGEYDATASRNITATGWVMSLSRGNVTTTFTQRLKFANTNVVSSHGSAQAINQTTDALTTVVVSGGGGGGGAKQQQQVQQSFPLYIFLGGDGSGTSSQRLMRRVEIGFDETRGGGGGGAATSRLRNRQAAAAEVTVRDDAVVGASWRMHQTYAYGASDGGCYVRNVSSVGYDVLFDHRDASCAAVTLRR